MELLSENPDYGVETECGSRNSEIGTGKLERRTEKQKAEVESRRGKLERRAEKRKAEVESRRGKSSPEIGMGMPKSENARRKLECLNGNWNV